MSEPHDDLNDLLAPKPGAESIGLRETLLAQIEYRLTRRVVMRRAMKITTVLASLAAVFVLGVAAGWTTRTPHERIVTANETVRVEVVTVVVPVPVPSRESSMRIAATPNPPTAAAAELQAEQADDPQEAARLYRLAGDRYLNDRDDYANAARCYRLYLARAGDSALTPEPGDTWLLVSLKNAAFKEKRNATNTDG